MTSCLHIMAGDAVVTQYRELHGFNTLAHTQTDVPGGSTGPGAESDIYDCLVTDDLMELFVTIV